LEFWKLKSNWRLLSARTKNAFAEALKPNPRSSVSRSVLVNVFDEVEPARSFQLMS
jgi:hypothetical protein